MDYTYRYSILKKCFTQAINNFENSLIEVDFERIKFLNEFYLKIQRWNPENEDIIEFKKYILEQVDEEIGYVEIGIEDLCSYNKAKKIVNSSIEDFKENEIRKIKNEIKEVKKNLEYAINFKLNEPQIIND